MATKQFLSLDGLTTYDGLIKQYIATEDAKSIKSITVVGNTVNFFKTADASGTAAYTVNLPDVSGFMEKIANAEGDKVVVSNSDGSVSESEIAIDDVVTNGGNSFTGGMVAITDSDRSISESDWGIGNAGSPAIMTGYVANVDSASGYLIVSADPDDEYDITGADIKVEDLVTNGGNSFSGDKVAITNSDGSLGEMGFAGTESGIATGYFPNNGDIVIFDSNAGSLTNADINVDDLATNAFVGSIPQGSSATTVVGYVDEVAGSITTASDVTLVEAQTPTTGYLKTYELYQGGNAAANLVGKIDIPKDLVVTSGEIVVNPTGQPAGTYLKLTIANQTTPVYINVADLCDAYTAASGATQVQLAISNTNEISATLVAGGVGTTQLANSAVTEGKIANEAVTTTKIADDAVTATKVNISEHTESYDGSYSDSCGISVSVSTTDAQVSDVSVGVHSGYLYANISDSVDTAISNAIGNLDADETQPAGADGLSLEVVQTDGLITSVTGSIAANTYDSYGAAATAESNANTYTDNATAAISTASIEALFE